MKYEKIIYETKDNIATITLNYPEKLNAWRFAGGGGMVDEFFAALTEAEDDDDVKVVIFKGAGPSFSSGHDLTEVGYVYGYGDGKKGEKKRRPSQRIRLKLDRFGLNEPRRRIFLCPKITIAQVHGHCVGEGILVMNCCDLAVAAEDASIGHTEQRLGFAGMSPTFPILVMNVGLKKALELLLTGKQLSGKEAAEIGMINMAVPPDRLDEETRELAKKIALLPRDGIAIGKAMRHIQYERLGLTSGFATGYVGHTLFTNLRWEDDEYSFFKARRDKGVRDAIHGKDDRFEEKDR
jgi:enoyl-CoA hydratase